MKQALNILALVAVGMMILAVPVNAQEELGNSYDLPTEPEPAPVEDAYDEAEPAAEPTGEAGDQALPKNDVEQYVVQEGDTLWDICDRQLGSPWYWQKVWAMNPHIANPHWIYPGNVVYFQEAGAMGAMVGMEAQGEVAAEGATPEEQLGADDLGYVPEIMDAEAWGTVSEGGRYRLDQYMSNLAKSGYNFYNHRRDGFIARNELRSAGVIANSPEEVENLSEYDTVYIKAEDINRFSIGQKYQIFRHLGEIEHPKTGEVIGHKVRVLGQLVIKRVTNKVVTAQITASYHPIERGDLVRPWKNPVKDIRPRRNKTNLRGYIVDMLLDNLILGENQVVFLDRGISQGIEEGNRLFVIRQLEPTGAGGGFDTDELPYEKIGEMIVLSAGSNTSVALISRSLMDLHVGDEVLMEKNY